MKEKKYRLETVLDIRIRAKDEAARIVALRLQQLEQAEDELSRRQKNLQLCFEKQNNANSLMNEELNKGLPANNILRHRNYLNDLRNLEIDLKAEVEKQLQVVARAEKELESARAKLTEAARELKAIEIHKANWSLAEKTEKTRQDQKISDEIGSILHGRRKGS